jgi:hypothetical protein
VRITRMAPDEGRISVRLDRGSVRGQLSLSI